MFVNRGLTFILLFVSLGWLEAKEAEKPQIDYLTIEYLGVEQNLWSLINGNNDPNSLYTTVLNEHQKFITSDFGVSSNTQNIYIPSGILVDNLRQVNDLFYNTSTFINLNSLDTLDIYYVHSILRNAHAYSENVFREAIRAEFWEKGKNVSTMQTLNSQSNENDDVSISFLVFETLP